MTEFLAIIAVGIGTYLSRGVFILALASKKISDPVLVALQFVAPAVLSALIVALLIDSDGNVAIGVAEVSAFIVGGAVAYKTRNHILTLIAGMGVFWLVRALI
ncbi:MAG: AzlD domain-containing protein [Acidimicrobiia bacterium]|jgi:branched-subunit amino acid transport protein